MKVSEYVAKMDKKVGEITFIKARARKDGHTPFYHPEYQTCPLYWKDEVIKKNILSDYIILNDRQESITWLSGADWNIHIRMGTARCLLVISPDDLLLLYPSIKQDDHMIKYIEAKLNP